MKIITDLSQFDRAKHPNLVVGLGNFDGLHLAHQEILKGICDRACQLGGTSSVFTFREHPQRVLHQKEDPPILTSVVHKLYLLEASGIDLCFMIHFTLPFSRIGPVEFIKQIFVDTLGAREIYLGFNARFGRDREGDSGLMRRLSNRFQFRFLEGPPVRRNGRLVSSSVIRALIHEGSLTEASELLGRRYSFFGTVVSGSGRGKSVGFPTANLDPHSEVMPPEGVYTAWVRVLDCQLVESEPGVCVIESRVIGDHLKALLNYGKRPTFGADEKPIPEVHILDYEEDLLNRTVEVMIGKRLRGEQTFDHEQALKGQIEHDIVEGRAWFSRQSKESFVDG